MQREVEQVDVVIVGGGPAGLSSAIRLKQLCKEQKKELRVCVLEKASYFGGHTLSGACIDPRALNELIPNWKELNCPMIPVTEDKFHYFTSKNNYVIPYIESLGMSNKSNYIGRLGHIVKWLSEQAELLGVELYPGAPVSEILYDKDENVKGVATVDLGIAKDGSPKESFTRGLEFHAKTTVLAEGCRGSLSKHIWDKYVLDIDTCSQRYSIGLKEMWEIDSSKHKPGKVEHIIGWPLSYRTYGGSFIYHYGEPNLVGVGIVLGLDYTNPNTSPFGELQKLKTHPYLRELLEGGKRIGYGARTLSEGGFQSIPRLFFPGGCVIGDDAGFMNASKMKGVHGAIKSGQLAAEALFDCIIYQKLKSAVILRNYEFAFRNSWLYDELKSSRNLKPSFNSPFGLYGMLVYASVFQNILNGTEPWTFRIEQMDHECLDSNKKYRQLEYPKPDGKLTFDLLSSLHLTGTTHDANQPSHLVLDNDNIPSDVNHEIFGGPSFA